MFFCCCFFISIFHFFSPDHFKMKVAVQACPHEVDVGVLYEYGFALNGLHLP